MPCDTGRRNTAAGKQRWQTGGQQKLHVGISDGKVSDGQVGRTL